MTDNWGPAAVVIGLIALIAATVCIVLLRRMQRSSLDRQGLIESQLSALDETANLIEARLAELHPQWPAPSEVTASTTEISAEAGEAPSGESIDPEIQAVIAAATVVAVGENARVRSAKLVKSHDDASPWSQQGRVLVQSSHNLLSRR
jgi:hypothetical protein